MTKKKNPKDLQKVGRKCILDTDLVAVGKLESAFAIGADVTLACSHAGISRDTYYEYIKKHPEKADKYAQLRRKPILKALNTVVANLDDPRIAKWYLQKKQPDEFGLSIDIGQKPQRPINLSDLTDEQILQLADEAVKEGI
jgi:hypothetical protein